MLYYLLQFTHHMYSSNDHACMRNYLDDCIIIMNACRKHGSLL